MTSSNVNIGLINPKSPDNVGSVMRAAGNYDASKVFYTGTRYKKAQDNQGRSANLSRKVGSSVAISGVNDLLSAIEDGMAIVCVELVIGAVPLPEYQHPENAFYIFGPEDGSIEQDIIDKADAVVYIPTIGCMNLAATVNVVLYDRLAKIKYIPANNQRIKQSRDRNNKLET